MTFVCCLVGPVGPTMCLPRLACIVWLLLGFVLLIVFLRLGSVLIARFKSRACGYGSQLENSTSYVRIKQVSRSLELTFWIAFRGRESVIITNIRIWLGKVTRLITWGHLVVSIGIACLETCGHLVVSVGYCTVVLIPSVCRRLEHFTGCYCFYAMIVWICLLAQICNWMRYIFSRAC
jgi:hypothetical protein